jgi:sortase B
MVGFLRRRFAALLLALALIFSLTACEARNTNLAEDYHPAPPAPPASLEISAPSFVNPLDFPAGPGNLPALPDSFSERAQEKRSINHDTVGWLYMPNTSIDDVIMWSLADDGEFYLRRNFEQRQSWEGSYFVDFRVAWGNFTRSDISRNIVVYGHSMEDINNVRALSLEELARVPAPLFTEFKKLENEFFARQNPYIFFSTLSEDMVWEVFSVHYSNIHVPYNEPNPSPEMFESLIADAQARSVWIYDVDVTVNDKILTLSTCCYNIPHSYSDEYRYVIMARLVPKDATLKTEASLTKNPSPVGAQVRPS